MSHEQFSQVELSTKIFFCEELTEKSKRCSGGADTGFEDRAFGIVTVKVPTHLRQRTETDR